MRTHRILVSRLCFQAARVPSDQAGCRRSSAEESATCEWGLGHPARRLGHFTAASSVQRDGRLELIMQSMCCGLMECLEGIRNPCKCLKKWSGRPDSNRRRPAWEAGILPLNYSRLPFISLTSKTSFHPEHRLNTVIVPAIFSLAGSRSPTCFRPTTACKCFDSHRAYARADPPQAFRPLPMLSSRLRSCGASPEKLPIQARPF